MNIEKPIFVIGAGRSGSTVFNRMFGEHDQVAWLSVLASKFPQRPRINGLLMSAIDYPYIGNMLRRKFGPGECYAFWEHYCKGFSSPYRDLRKEDLTLKQIKRIKKSLSYTLVQGRLRLLIKITGWPRIGFIDGVFPDAKFIHVLRDGRGVANSSLNTTFWQGWQGPQNWRWGLLPDEYQQELETHNRSFVALAGIQWKILMDAMEDAKKCISADRFLEIKYEDLCSDVYGVFKKVIDFSELDWTQSFERRLKFYSLNSKDYKWKEDLTNNQHKILHSVLQRHLEHHKYI